MDVLCLCQFDWGATWQLYGPSLAPQIVNAVTGWDVDLDELKDVGARRVNLLKLFNMREGFTREDDKLPPRLHEPLTGGLSDGWTVTDSRNRARQGHLLHPGRLGRGHGKSDAGAFARVGDRRIGL